MLAALKKTSSKLLVLNILRNNLRYKQSDNVVCESKRGCVLSDFIDLVESTKSAAAVIR